jgi:hypothetical protein
MILFGPNYLKEVRDNLKRSTRTTIAVAFWGEGAETTEGLGLIDVNPESVELICNLTMGGSNPDVIRKFKAKGFNVRHSERLHAKVFRCLKSMGLSSRIRSMYCDSETTISFGLLKSP